MAYNVLVIVLSSLLIYAAVKAEQVEQLKQQRDKEARLREIREADRYLYEEINL